MSAFPPHHTGPIDESIDGVRSRAAYLDSFVDMIPARFYLGSAVQEFGEKEQSKMNKNLDPAQVKTTSQLVAELARAAAKASDEKKEVVSRRDKKKDKKQKQNSSADNVAASSGPARNRAELKAKLDKRIEELKAERRLKQSEQDKANNAGKDADGGKAKAGKKEGKSDKQKKRRMSEDGSSEEEEAPRPEKKQKKTKSGEVEVDIEAGRLNFEPKVAKLPFGADVNRAGSKMKDLRKHLRVEERNVAKLNQLSGKEREGAKQNLEMEKALQRARGEKVHDDITKLRKTQKQREVAKKKGTAKFEERAKSIKEAHAETAKKKQENIKDHYDKSKKGVAAQERKDRNRQQKEEERAKKTK